MAYIWVSKNNKKLKNMIRITLTNGKKISGVTLVDKLLEDGSRFTIAVKGEQNI